MGSRSDLHRIVVRSCPVRPGDPGNAPSGTCEAEEARSRVPSVGARVQMQMQMQMQVRRPESPPTRHRKTVCLHNR